MIPRRMSGVLADVRARPALWDLHHDLDERQLSIVGLFLEGFEGKLQTNEYPRLTET